MTQNKSVEELRKALLEPFYADEIEWKSQAYNNKDRKLATKVLMVPYVQARAIMTRLDEVVGIPNWKDEYEPGPDGGVLCKLSLRIDGEWVTKSDGAANTQVEEVKGGLSNAFKRAAVKWGIGRYLYEVPMKWVDLKEPGGRPKEDPKMPMAFLPQDAMADGSRPLKKDTRAGGELQAQAPKSSVNPIPQVTEQGTNGATVRDLAWAKAFIIPRESGVPLNGKTLEEASQNEIGKAVIRFLSGEFANKSGNLFEPKNEALKLAQDAAKIMLDQVDGIRPKPKEKSN